MIQTRTYDCLPTLNDTDVFNFCKTGYLMLESVVDDAINRQTTDYIDKNGHHSLLNEDWFIEAVFYNPQAAGAVRSLLARAIAWMKVTISGRTPAWMNIFQISSAE